MVESRAARRAVRGADLRPGLLLRQPSSPLSQVYPPLPTQPFQPFQASWLIQLPFITVFSLSITHSLTLTVARHNFPYSVEN